MTQVAVQGLDGGVEVAVLPGPKVLAREAAERIVRQAQAAVDSRGRFSVALAGGSTPEHTYRLLAELPYRDQIRWQDVHLFWGDERCVPPDDPASNYRLARRALIDGVPIPPENVHRVLGELEPEVAAQAYDRDLQDYFCGPLARLDLVLLGLGSDGHTASLFPGSSLLEETKQAVAAVRAPVERGSVWRVTLTLATINASRQVLFLVSGAEKAQAVAAVLGGSGGDLPAEHVCPTAGQVTWLLDRAAATGLAGGAAGKPA